MLRGPRPRSSGRNTPADTRAPGQAFRRLTLRSATGTAQRAISTGLVYRPRAAFTLIEVMLATGVAILAVTCMMVFFYYASCSFASMSNYADLDRQSQVAIDNFTRQVRQTIQLNSYTTTNSIINGLTFLDYDSNTLTFSYNPGTGILTRTKSGASQPFLTNCTSLQFQIFQRNLQSGTLDAVTTATAANCKLVQVDWSCAKNILGTQANSESVQSAKVVIR